MRALVDFKNLSRIIVPNIVNLVTNEELLTYQTLIKKKAVGFVSKFNGGVARGKKNKDGTEDEHFISKVGWSVQDVEQELMIKTWQLLQSYDPNKSYEIGVYGLCSKRTFILHCLDNTLKMLVTKIWASKRGYKSPHDSGGYVINGEYEEDV